MSDSYEEKSEKHAYERLVFLSDGVLAIAITLAALEIRPEIKSLDLYSVWKALEPSLLTYAISFLVISTYWITHRRMYSAFCRVDVPLTLLNLLLLGLVSIHPAALALIEHHNSHGTVMMYLALVAATGFSQTLFWCYAAFLGKLTEKPITLQYKLNQLIISMIMPFSALALIITGG